MERVTGFEPVPIAWKAIVLAINTTPAQSGNYNKKGSNMLPIFINTQVMRKASYALASMHLAFSINSFLIFSAIGFLIQFELISLEKFSLYILLIHMKELGLSFL